MTTKIIRGKAIFILIVWVFVLTVAYSALSIVRYLHFQSGGFDLGIYDQAVWQYSNFYFPYNTIKEKFILADHLTLTLPLLAPLYWIWDDVKSLLIFQAFWVSFSSFAIYLYLLKRGFGRIEALVLTGLYSIFFGIQYGVNFDFHPSSIGLGLLAWVLYFWESEKWKLFTISVFLLLITQENMGISLFALTIVWFFQKKNLKLSFVVLLISLTYTFTSINFMNNVFVGGYEYKANFARSIAEFISRFFDDKQKIQVWLFSSSWFSFTPLLSPSVLIAFIIENSQYFVTGEQFNRMWSPFTHHRLNLAVFALIGAANTLLMIKNSRRRRTLVLLMLVVGLFLQYNFHFPLNKLSKKEFWKSESWMENNNAMLSKIPKDASVAAQQSLVPHLSHRKNIFLIYPRKHAFDGKVCKEKECWWLDFAGNPEFLAVDVHDGVWSTMLLEDASNFKKALTNMEKSKMIELVYREEQARLYRINYKNLSL